MHREYSRFCIYCLLCEESNSIWGIFKLVEAARLVYCTKIESHHHPITTVHVSISSSPNPTHLILSEPLTLSSIKIKNSSPLHILCNTNTNTNTVEERRVKEEFDRENVAHYPHKPLQIHLHPQIRLSVGREAKNRRHSMPG